MLDYVARVVSHIGEADDPGSLLVRVHSGLHGLGFDNFNLACHKRRAEELILEPTLTTWSVPSITEYALHYQFEKDPLLAYASGYGQPKIWSPKEWKESLQFGEYANYLVGNGIQGGVTAPLTQRPGVMSAITAVSYTVSAITADTATAIYVIGQAGMLRAGALGLIESAPAPTPAALATLTDAQAEILDWARQGKTNGEIAVITGRTPRTVAYHMSEILQKLGVSTRAQAVALLPSR